jgi:SAM-dependent methyltransferase
VLDAGCGTGRVGRELARRAIDVVGVDIDPEMLATARRKAPGVDWRLADLATVDLARPFDAAIAAGNVMIFLTPGTERAVIGNLARHLSPGGLLIAGFQPRDRMPLDRYDALCLDAGLEQNASRVGQRTVAPAGLHIVAGVDAAPAEPSGAARTVTTPMNHGAARTHQRHLLRRNEGAQVIVDGRGRGFPPSRPQKRRPECGTATHGEKVRVASSPQTTRYDANPHWIAARRRTARSPNGHPRRRWRLVMRPGDGPGRRQPADRPPIEIQMAHAPRSPIAEHRELVARPAPRWTGNRGVYMAFCERCFARGPCVPKALGTFHGRDWMPAVRGSASSAPRFSPPEARGALLQHLAAGVARRRFHEIDRRALEAELVLSHQLSRGLLASPCPIITVSLLLVGHANDRHIRDGRVFEQL